MTDKRITGGIMEPKFEGLTSLAYEPCCMGQYLGLFGLIKILYDKNL